MRRSHAIAPPRSPKAPLRAFLIALGLAANLAWIGFFLWLALLLF